MGSNGEVEWKLSRRIGMGVGGRGGVRTRERGEVIIEGRKGESERAVEA